jgi:predicted CopG family antitoxin
MGTKTISILDEAYENLKREKEKDESFSDVILRLTNRKGSIRECLGKWKMSDEEVKEFRDELKRAWKEFGKK